MIKILIIFGLVSLLDHLKPFGCTLIYTLMIVTFMLMAGAEFTLVMVYGAIRFVLAFIYFWLLDEAVDGVLWWIIAILGLFLLV